MYEPTAIDRYLAFHAPRLIGFDPKKKPAEVTSVLVAALSSVIGVVAMRLVGSWFGMLILVLLVVAAIAYRNFQSNNTTTKETFAANLYHQVYGKYGWNEDAGARRSTEPVPIRSASKVLKLEAFDLLESAASQAMRVHVAASTSELARRAGVIVDQTMVQIFAMAESVQAGGPVPAQAVQSVQQIRELADHLNGIRDPLPAFVENGVSPLESILFDARAEHKARMELNLGVPDPVEQQQQQQ